MVLNTYIYIYIYVGRSSGQHPVSSHSCWMYVRAGRPAFARPCVGVHKSTSLMSSSLLLQQCPACLVRLTWIVFVIGGRWSYSWCLVGCCRQDLFEIARSILVQLPSSFFSSRFVSVHVVHPYSSIDVTAAWKKLRFILSIVLFAQLRSFTHRYVTLTIQFRHTVKELQVLVIESNNLIQHYLFISTQLNCYKYYYG